MIYAINYLKGGVGKTTTAVHLATHFAQSGPTLLIDGDPQESAAAWAAWRAEAVVGKSPVTMCLRGKAVFDQGKEAAQQYQNTVVDAGGRDGAGLRNALLVADKVIVPMGSSGLDAAVLNEYLGVVDEARSFNRRLDLRVVVFRLDPRSKDAEIREFLADHGVQAFKQTIRERSAFRKATNDGLTVEEYKPRDAAATYEMGKLYEEIRAWA